MGNHADSILIFISCRLPKYEDGLGRSGEFGGTTKTAKSRIVGGFDLFHGIGDHTLMEFGIGGRFPHRYFGQFFCYSVGVSLQLSSHFFVIPQLVYAFTKIHKIWFAKIGASEKRFLIRCNKDAHGPPASASGGLNKGHVNLVNIRSFLAIQLDANKMFVE